MRRPRKIWVPPAARNRTPVQHYLPRLLERIEKGEIDPARQAAAKVGLEQHAGLPGGIIMRRTVFAILGLLVAIPSLAGAQQDRTTDSAVADFQKDFAAAYNRGDVDAMAAAFTEKAVRVTPSGIFQGRDAIRRGFQDALKLGLHDYSVRRVISRSEGSFTFNAGEWQAKLGDQPFHGYYTAIVVQDGGQTMIMEETVTVAAP